MIGLAFSGGKDSLACWYLCKQSNPIVFWVNTGKAYPETQKLVNEIKKEAFEFVEIRTDQQKNIDDYGIPSDLVPINFSPIGMIFNGTKSIKVQSYLDCCWTNISQPLMKAVKEKGYTYVFNRESLLVGPPADNLLPMVAEKLKVKVPPVVSSGFS
jgi:phosphoadenosine phosphosulfate reductase